jgi:hypothetical protein
LANSGGDFGISPYLQEIECYYGQNEIYESGSEALEKLLHIPMNKKQIERVTKHYGDCLEKELEKESLEQLPRSVEKDEQVYAMIDGSMIFTRLGEWKEVKLGRIFSSKVLYSVSSRRNWIQDSFYVAHVGACEDFLNKFESYTDRYDNNLVFVCDGARWIWKWVETHYPGAIQILDYYHAVQHLTKFADLVFKEKEAKNNWKERQKQLIWDGAIEQVIQNIEAANCTNVKQRKERQDLINYYQTNMERMRYEHFRQQGLLIGSGPIESAHRTVIQKRLKLSGQRWTIGGAQQVLNLRVAHMSGYWQRLIDLVDNRKRA